MQINSPSSEIHIENVAAMPKNKLARGFRFQIRRDRAPNIFSLRIDDKCEDCGSRERSTIEPRRT